ncbi:MAG: PorT family protein [Candidatus Aminicenantes bacterium]|nr:PorT family protein [Candidatus Aminicenantes bacterium]
MKKFVVLLMLAAFLALGSARGLQAVEFRNFGLKFGLTSGSLRAVEDEGSYTVEKFKEEGFAGGFFVEIPVVWILSLRPEVLFFQKGGEYDVGVPVSIPNIKINVFETRSMDYIEVPLMIKSRIPLFRGVGTGFIFGPSLGVNLNGKVVQKTSVQAPGFTVSFPREENIKGQLKTLELSFALGGDVDIALPKGKLFIEQRFFFAFKTNPHRIYVPARQFQEVGFPVAQDIVKDLDMYNYVFFVALGYSF